MQPNYIDTNGERVDGWKTPFNHSTTAAAKEGALVCLDKSRTQEQFKDQADINNIVQAFLKTGEIKQIPNPMQYGIQGEDDYHELMTRLAETNALFYKLDAETRADYQNDPGKWLQDVNDQLEAGNLEPLRAMGLDVPERKQELPETKNEGTPPAATPAPVPPTAAS